MPIRFFLKAVLAGKSVASMKATVMGLSGAMAKSSASK
jgi:hypothetical protein